MKTSIPILVVIIF